MRRIAGISLVALVALLLPPGSAGADPASAFSRSLDPPAATKIVKPRSGDDPVGQVTCTYYADLMVRETGTDSPDPADAAMVPLRPGAVRPSCAATPAHAIALKTEGYALTGRKGGFLIWDASDPNGAEPFKVIDARSGKVLFEDGVAPALGLRRTASLEHGRLRLTYRRAVNVDCSIVENAGRCWAKLVAAGQAPRSLTPLTQPPKACLAAYRRTPKTDPSILEYALDVTIDAAGRASVNAQGPVGCEPQP